MDQDGLVVLELAHFFFTVGILLAVVVETQILITACLDLFEEFDRTLLNLLSSFFYNLPGLSFFILLFLFNFYVHCNIAWCLL